MYPRIPCEPVADALGAAEYSLGTVGLAGQCSGDFGKYLFLFSDRRSEILTFPGFRQSLHINAGH